MAPPVKPATPTEQSSTPHSITLDWTNQPDAASYRVFITPNGGVEYESIPTGWTAFAAPTTPRYFFGSAYYNNKIYIFGGTSSTGQVLDSVEELDLAAGTWTTKQPMPQALTFVAAAVDHGGFVTTAGIIYIPGGRTVGGLDIDTIYEYNTNTNTWSNTHVLPRGLSGVGTNHDASLWFTSPMQISPMLFVGGQSGGAYYNDTTLLRYVYDGSTGWQVAPQNPLPYSAAGVAVASNRQGYYFFAAIGGHDAGAIRRDVNIFSEQTSWAWSGLPQYPIPICYASAYFYYYGSTPWLYVMGGLTSPDTSLINSVPTNKIYRISMTGYPGVSGSWEEISGLPEAMYGGVSVVTNLTNDGVSVWYPEYAAVGGYDAAGNVVDLHHSYSILINPPHSVQGLPSDTTFGVEIIAKNTSGEESVRSDPGTATTDPIAAPTNVSVLNPTQSTVQVSWTPPAEVDTYRIYLDDGSGYVPWEGYTASTWLNTIPSAVAGQENPQAGTIGNRVYLYKSTQLFFVDTETQTWVNISSHPDGVVNSAMVAFNDKLYFFGGNDGVNNSNATWEYDPAQDVWTSKAAMSTYRDYPTALLLGTAIYIIGGYNTPGANESNYFEIYNPSVNVWAPPQDTPAIPQPLVKTGAAAYYSATTGWEIHCFCGGRVGSISSEYHFRYSINTETWWDESAAMQSAFPSGWLTGVQTYSDDTYIYVIGGTPGTGVWSSQIRRYHRANQTWDVDSLALPFGLSHAAKTEHGGSILLLSGLSNFTANTSIIKLTWKIPSTTTSHTIYHLDSSTDYTVDVRAVDEFGGESTPESSTAAFTTADGPPEIPTGLTVGSPLGTTTARLYDEEWLIRDTEFKMRWNAANGATGYKITLSPAGTNPNPIVTTNTELVIDGLTEDTLYTITMVAYNGAGDSLPSTELQVRTAHRAPSQGSMAVNPLPNGDFEFTWENLPEAINDSNERYVFWIWSYASGAAWKQLATSNTFTLTQFQLQANSYQPGQDILWKISCLDLGEPYRESTPNQAITVLPCAKPIGFNHPYTGGKQISPNINLRQNITNNSFELDWTQEGAATTYKVYLDENPTPAKISSTKPVEIISLSPIQNYSVVVGALNIQGQETLSDPFIVRTLPDPVAPSLDHIENSTPGTQLIHFAPTLPAEADAGMVYLTADNDVLDGIGGTLRPFYDNSVQFYNLTGYYDANFTLKSTVIRGSMDIASTVPESNYSTGLIVPSVPGLIEGINVTNITESTCDISWNSKPIATSYNIVVSQSDGYLGEQPTYTTATTSQHADSLSLASVHYIKITGTNSTGEGALNQVTVGSKAATVTNFVAGAPTTNAIPVTWTSMPSHRYYLTLNGSPVATIAPNEPGSYVFIVASPDTTYTLGISAEVAATFTTPSTEITIQATTEAEGTSQPPQPTNFVVGTTTAHTIPATWDVLPNHRYHLFVNQVSVGTVEPENPGSFVYNVTRANTTYDVGITAEILSVPPATSELLEVQATTQALGDLTNIDAEVRGAELVVFWDEPAPEQLITQYRIHYSTNPQSPHTYDGTGLRLNGTPVDSGTIISASTLGSPPELAMTDSVIEVPHWFAISPIDQGGEEGNIIAVPKNLTRISATSLAEGATSPASIQLNISNTNEITITWTPNE